MAAETGHDEVDRSIDLAVDDILSEEEDPDAWEEGWTEANHILEAEDLTLVELAEIVQENDPTSTSEVFGILEDQAHSVIREKIALSLEE